MINMIKLRECLESGGSISWKPYIIGDGDSKLAIPCAVRD